MKRILIADDALDLGRALQTMLLTLDPAFVISVVPSAEEAVLEAGRHKLDLLIADLRLPGISGIELIGKIRARQPGVRVIVMTALSDGPIVDQAHTIQVDGFFQKPLDFPAFLETSRQLLGVTGPVRALEPARPAPTETHLTPGTISDMLAGLRHELGAQAVILLNENGHPAVKAGDLPGNHLEGAWSAALMAALNSVERAARLAGRPDAEQAICIKGKDFDFILAPAGLNALLIVLKKGRASLRLALAVEEALAMQKDLAKAINNLSASPPEATPPPPESLAPVETPAAPADMNRSTEAGPAETPEAAQLDSAQLEELETLIKTPEQHFEPGAVDAYWDQFGAEIQPPPLSADVLNYEQAARLGLAPGDIEKT